MVRPLAPNPRLRKDGIWMGGSGMDGSRMDGGGTDGGSMDNANGAKRKLRLRRVERASLAECALDPNKALRRELEESNRRFDGLLDHIWCGIAIYRHTSGCSFIVDYMSEGLCRMCGAPREVLMAEYSANGLAGVDPAFAPEVFAAYRKVATTLEPAEVTYRVRVHRPEPIWVTLRLTARRQGDETVVYGAFTDVTELVEARERVRETQLATEAACTFAKLWTFGLDLDTGIVYPDARLQADFDCGPALEGFPESYFGYGFILPEYRDLCHGEFERLYGGAPDVDFCIQSMLAQGDGKPHWLRFRGQALAVAPGSRRMAAISVQLVDNQKAVEARVELERKRMLGSEAGLLLHFVADPANNTVLEGRDYHTGDVLADESGTALYGDVVAEGCRRVRNEADRAELRASHSPEALFDAYRRGEDRWQRDYQCTTPEGRDVWSRFVAHLLYEPQSDRVLLYEYIYDVTTEKLIGELLGVVLANGYETVGCLDLVDHQFLVLTVDAATGGPRVQSVDYAQEVRRYAEQKLAEDQRDQYIARCVPERVREAALRGESFVYRVNEGGEVRYKRSYAYVTNASKNLCLITRADVTELIEAEEAEKSRLAKALDQATEAARAKTDFLARMSHDIRTPLNAIVGLSALTIDDAQDARAVCDNMSKMRSSCDFLLSLVDDILDLAKIEDGAVSMHPEPYRYDEFLLNMRTMFVPQCEAKGIRITFKQPQKNPIINVDRMRLNQVFFNVFSNAVKYTDPGGSIDYSVRNFKVEGGRLWVDYVIADTGIGMSAAYQKRLFEPFARENDAVTPELRGTGLGLSITKHLVELMGGAIDIKSEQGVGTTVTLHMEFECLEPDAAPRAVPVRGGGDMGLLQGKRVLLAEDHPLNAQIARRLLEKAGMRVTHVDNGRLAVDAFRTSLPGEFDVVLMDIRMPQMSGLDAARGIRDLPRPDAGSVPIVALSANAYPDDVQMSLDAGMNAHLAKPIDPEDLYRLLARYLP